MKKWIALYALSGIIIILFNLFPRYNIKKMEHESRGDVFTNVASVMNEPYFENYDMKHLEQGYTLIAYDNGNLNCYWVNEICNSAYERASSQITLYDQHMEVIWNIGGYLTNETDILFQNHHINVRAVDQLNDGSFVAFGRSVDLSTEILRDVLLFIDPSGVMTNLKVIDLLSYGYLSLGGHLFYDVVATDDGGFTLKFTDLFKGTVLIHFDANAEETWFVRMDDVHPSTVYQGIYHANYLETLRYADGLAIVLINDTVHAYNDEGVLIYKVDVDAYITGFSLDSSSNVIITYMMQDQVIKPRNLFMISDEQWLISSIVTEKLDGKSGQSLWKSRYQSKMQGNVSYCSLMAWQDEDQYYYNLVYQQSFSRVREYQLFLFKYNRQGQFLASNVIDGSYATWDDYYTMYDIHFKKSVIIENKTIHLLTPTLTNNASYEINDAHILQPMPITFSLNLYEIVIRLRTEINTIFSLITISGMCWIGLLGWRRYQKNNPPLDDI